MDIGKGKGGIESELSNFHRRRFTFDGVLCESIEGVVQAFKFDKEHIQHEVCQLFGLKAKFRGKKRNKAWRSHQTLWWKGKNFDRDSDEYQRLLDRLFIAVAQQDESFRRALIASGDAVFTHSVGKNKEADTVLTVREFCSRLTKLRILVATGKIFKATSL